MDMSGNDPLALTECLGIRYQPEYTVDTVTFTPLGGDLQGSVFGFRNKTHGTVSSQRFALQQTGLVGTPVVLSGCWPNTRIAEWNELGNTRQTAPFNGRRMYAAINIRRTDVADVTDNDDVVLRLQVRYTLCDGTTGFIRFDSLPNPNGATGGRIALPLRLDGSGRGQASTLVNNISGVPSTQMVITRRMIPRGSDATRDITLMAHFILDNDPYENGDTPGSLPAENFNSLRLLTNTYLDADCNADNAGLIRELNVEVIYAGNSDVAIDWVQLASDNGTRLLQGYYDIVARQACADILQDFREYNDSAQKSLRIYRWFNRDEGKEAYWEGMRYFHQLFWQKTVTERNMGREFTRYNYHVGADLTWQGYTPVFNTRTIVPYYRNGFMNDAVANNTGNMPALNTRRSEYLMNEWGMQSPEGVTPINYDLRWGLHPSSTSSILPADTISGMNVLYPKIDFVKGAQFSSGGLQQKYETDRYQMKEKSDFLFDDLRPWVGNAWLHSDWSAGDDNAIPAQHFNEWRVLSGEEARLLVNSQIILGSKGIFLYWGASMDSITTPSQYNRDNGLAKDIGICANIIQPNWFIVGFRDTSTASAMSTYMHNLSFNSEEAGGDYLIQRFQPGTTNLAYGYRFGLREAIDGWLPTTPPTPANRLATVSTRLGLASNDGVYVGTRSIRMVTKEITDVLWRGQDTLQNLRLRGWYSKGFREWFVGDSAKYATAFGTNKPLLKTRHLYRDGTNLATTPKTYEAFDSSFVEATVLQYGTSSMQSRFVVGILNRRCDPFDYTDASSANYQSYAEWETALRAVSSGSRPTARYRQRGAREVVLPFNFKHSDGKYRLLRVVEYGATADPAVARTKIDTIIGQDKSLSVMFLPGEGKMFHVQVLSSENSMSTSGTGYLDHSNQRKLVAFPVMHSATTRTANVTPHGPADGGRLASWTRYVAGDSMRYHVVYHRRDQDNVMRVYYRRSDPMLYDRSDSFPSSLLTYPHITWEAPIDLTQQISIRNEFGDSIASAGDCGFPSIVVRPDVDGSTGVTWPNATSPLRRMNMVYVVFTCKECPSGVWNVSVNHIKFPADIPAAQQALAVTSPGAFRLDMFPTTATAPPHLDSIMYKWGTPTINASTRGNFIAWSHPFLGIRAAFLYPYEDALPVAPMPARAIDNIRLRTTAGYETAAHPSLNTYSRLNLGEIDAGLVWQEGPSTEYGRSIAYTRLFADANGNTTHHIATNIPWMSWLEQWGGWVGANRQILEIGGNGQQPPLPVGTNEFSRNMRYPMIFRNLSDYDITNANMRYTEGLVSQKAERIFWETLADYRTFNGTTYVPVASTWEIARRAIDINDYGSHDSTQYPMLWGKGPYLIWSDTRHLNSPNVAQGEQLTENAGVPNPTGPWYQDSVNTVNFTGSNAGGGRDIYHLTYGFSYYGANVNHTLAGYSDIKKLTAQGYYPQLAARFSSAEHPGWHRNRRIYESWPGVRNGFPNYLASPVIKVNHEQFYKEGSGDEERIVEFTGYRDGYGRTWSVGGIRFAEGDTALSMYNVSGDNRFMSGEVAVPAVSNLFVNSRIEPGTEGARLTIRRASDGAVLNVPLGVAEGEGLTQEHQWSLVSDATERYTFSLETDQNAAQELTPVSDIGILTTQPVLQRRASQGLIDLRAMKIAASDEARLDVYPTPASDHVTVVMTGKMDMSGAVSYSVTDLTGRSVLSGTVDSPGVWHLDISGLLNGAYQLHVKNSTHHMMTRFVVAR